MGEYYCDCCGRRLDSCEVNTVWDDKLDELYVSCKYCGSECFEFEEEDFDGEDEDFDEDEEYANDED